MNKPIPGFLLIFLLSMLVATTFYSCDECEDCPPPGGSLNLRYTHNGQNGIFGTNAIIDRDSIYFSNLEVPGMPADFWLVDSTMSIRIFLRPTETYVLNLGSSHADTFQMTDYLQPRGRYCPVTIALDVKMNGELVCDGDCEEVIEREF